MRGIINNRTFLCRQTNFIQAVAEQGIPVNIKKGQFAAPWDMERYQWPFARFQ
jgi:2-dehydro-3-deoxyphosphooctonate aldolase (KDO 8-P synthase)